MKSNASVIALCGVLAALAVTFMVLGGLFPLAAYCAPVLASALLLPVLHAAGKKLAWAWFSAVAFLSILLCPDPEASALFLFIGYYPIVKTSLDRIRSRFLRVCAKLLLFNAALAGMLLVLMYVLMLPEIAEEMASSSPALLAVMVLMGNTTFFLTDMLLSRLERILLHKKRH